ncbi:MAG TPA: DoxX family protein [Bryobacteraceae bacterium]|jgi:putative oxidoreductase|nr:DoxX family protein [Bryobacteraceae bacterium]
MMKFLAPYEPRLRSLLRIMAAFTFSLHGWQKFFGIPQGHKFPLDSLLGIAGALETFGGALIFLGLFTRPVAFLLSGEMAIGYFRTHAPRSFWPVINMGEITVLYCFLFLWLSAAGPGPWSVDRLLGKEK